MKVKTINSLMKYLRDKKGISIQGSAQKRKLKNIGYYHGYKGYRFVNKPKNLIKYSDFNELLCVYEFDMQIKSLIYPQIMFLETAFKNYALDNIIRMTDSDRFADAYSKAMLEYKNNKIGTDAYKKAIQKRLNLRNRIYSDLSRDYSNKLIVQHYYSKDKPVPIWAVFELISFGEFGVLLTCLNTNIKRSISEDIGFNKAQDADGRLSETLVYVLKDLRNAVAHNDPVFDVRFKTSKINTRIPNYLSSETGIQDIDFNSIVDYIILICYLLKCFGLSKNEIKKFIRDFINCCENLRKNIPVNIYTKILLTNTRKKLNKLLNYI